MGVCVSVRVRVRVRVRVSVCVHVMQWQSNRAALESSGEKVLEALRKGTAIAGQPGETPPPAPDVAHRCFQQLAHSYEEEYGGFRDAPKFPSPGPLTHTHTHTDTHTHSSYWAVNFFLSPSSQ